jgi:hypothetical protein
MEFILTYNKFLESLDHNLSNDIIDLNESLSMWHDLILKSIGGEELDIYDTLKITRDELGEEQNLEFLFNSPNFINSLSSIGLKKSSIFNSDDYETFVKKPIKFGFIYKIEANELENPDFIIYQVWNESSSRWEEIKFWSIKDDIKKFYDKLSSKVIEISDNDKKWIYSTSNGNEWVLQNSELETPDFKKYIRKEDLEELIKSKKLKIKII